MGLSERHEVDIQRESWKQDKVTCYCTRIYQLSRLELIDGRFRWWFYKSMEELLWHDKSRSSFTHCLASIGGCAACYQNLHWYVLEKVQIYNMYIKYCCKISIIILIKNCIFSNSRFGYQMGAEVAHISSNGRCSHCATLGRRDRIEEARYTNWRRLLYHLCWRWWYRLVIKEKIRILHAEIGNRSAIFGKSYIALIFGANVVEVRIHCGHYSSCSENRARYELHQNSHALQFSFCKKHRVTSNKIFFQAQWWH